MTYIHKEKRPHWKGLKLWYFLIFLDLQCYFLILCAAISPHKLGLNVCARSFLWLIHDWDFYHFMKIRVLQDCRLGKLQPCQADVLLQQPILKENYTIE